MPIIEDPAAQVQEGLENKAIMPSVVHDFLLFLQTKEQNQAVNQ